MHRTRTQMGDPVLGRAMALLVLAAVAATACHSSGPGTSGTGGGSGSGTPTGGSGGSGVVGGGSSKPVYPLGTVSPGPANTAFCLPGDDCKGFFAACPETGKDTKFILSIGDPTGPNRGVLVFLSGGGGNKLWSQEAKQDLAFSGQGGTGKGIDQQAAQQAANFLQDLRQRGYMTIQVVWPTAWLAAPPGDQVGPARLGCRPATALKYIHDSYFAKMGVNPGPLKCGFCVAGNSGGATQIGYSLAFYGLGDIIDAAVMSGGPPHAALDKACLNEPGFQYNTNLDGVLDASYGFSGPQHGPCVAHDQSYAAKWRADGIDTGGRYYSYPNTRVLFLLGGQDDTQVGPHQLAYYQKVKQSGSPTVEQITIPDMTHAITASSEGLNDIKSWFLG